MDNKQAIEYFDRLKGYAAKFQEQYPEYKQFTPAVDLAISALNKQIPMEVNVVIENNCLWHECPACGNRENGEGSYCCKCGQSLYWTLRQAIGE